MLLLTGAPVAAIEPGEVRQYGEVFVISAEAVAPDRVEIRWDIAQDHYLYNNRFLGFSTTTPGVALGEPEIPEGKASFDELLGEEVIKYHDQLVIGLPLARVEAGVRRLSVDVRSQGCLEGVLCYPPTSQTVQVELPAAVDIASVPRPIAGTSPLDTLLGASPAVAPGAGAPALPADQAFRYEAIALNAATALVRFTAQPGYYLYVDKFAFRVRGDDLVSVAAVELPAGTVKDDPEFGPVPVVYGQVEIPVHFERPAGPGVTVSLIADWQGCRDGDICYPPQTGELSVDLPVAPMATGAPIAGAGPAVPVAARSTEVSERIEPPRSEQGRLAALLVDRPAGALVAFFVAGLLLAFTPCVFPMVPILSGIIAGEGDRITTARAFWLSLVYVLAMAVTYTVAGVLAGLFGQNLQAMFQNPWIISAFVAVFVLLALSMFGFYELQLPTRWQSRLAERSNRQQGGRQGGVAVMGFLSALIVGPCVAPPLAAALIVIGETGSPLLGGAALFALSLGMGLPLVVFGASAGKLLPRAGAWMNAVKAVFGVGLLALAIWMLERIVPGPVIMVLWGLLAIACAVYLGALERIPEGATGWRKLWKALGVALLVFGAIEFIGAASGGDWWLRPLSHLSGDHRVAEADHVTFARIKSLDDLRREVRQANAQGRPAMLDFYADWCVECIRMERNTFPEPPVQALLAQMHPLQADVTDNDDVDQALMGAYGVIGPPAILFFGPDGAELEDFRLVGYFTPDEFAAHLRQVLAAR